jgi:hypothetical protein
MMAKLNRWRGRRLKVDFRHGTISRRVRFGSTHVIENSEPNFRNRKRKFKLRAGQCGWRMRVKYKSP